MPKRAWHAYAMGAAGGRQWAGLSGEGKRASGRTRTRKSMRAPKGRGGAGPGRLGGAEIGARR